MALGTASTSKAEAISVIQGESAASSKNKSADAWHGFYAALMSLKSCSHPSCGTSSTATTEASLSEVGSSHGGSSPRKLWGDIEEEDEEDASDIEPIQEDSDLVLTSSSKRTRRRANRRRRTRGGRRSSARRAQLDGPDLQGCDTIDEELALGSVAASPSCRDVVLLSDLHLGLDSPAGRTKMLATADFPGSPCFPRGGPHPNSSTSPSNIVRTISTGSDASARIPIATSEALCNNPTSPCCVHASAITNMCASPCSAFATFTGDASTRTGSAHFSSSAAWPMEQLTPQKTPNARQITPHENPKPDGVRFALPSPPCHAWATSGSGIVSTSPMAMPGPCSPAHVAMAGAGSQSADKLRSWLQASGLPSAADIMAQLQAAAPDFYED